MIYKIPFKRCDLKQYLIINKKGDSMKIVEVAKAAKTNELPISVHTAYKWHTLKKYPRLVYKVTGKLFFDLEEWEQMALQARDKNVKTAARIHTVE
jgi:hypothetical protein